jgi:hypothetical protein
MVRRSRSTSGLGRLRLAVGGVLHRGGSPQIGVGLGGAKLEAGGYRRRDEVGWVGGHQREPPVGGEAGRGQGALHRRRAAYVLQPGRPPPLGERRDQPVDLLRSRLCSVVRDRVVAERVVGVVAVGGGRRRSG